MRDRLAKEMGLRPATDQPHHTFSGLVASV